MNNVSLIQAARKLVREYGVRGELLHQAMPYLNSFKDKTFVLKVGGSVLDSMLVDNQRLVELINDIVFLKAVGINIIIVHGGGKMLDAAMQKEGIELKKINGLRVTSEPVALLAKEVFHSVSNAMQEQIIKAGFECHIFDADTKLVQSRQLAPELKAVGEPQVVDIGLFDPEDPNLIPVIPAITASCDNKYAIYNVNADDVACAVASAVQAEKLILMTDVEGVLDQNGALISTLTKPEVDELVAQGVIKSGMLPKVQSCLNALAKGVHHAHIIKGDHQSFMDEILTDQGVGTLFN